MTGHEHDDEKDALDLDAETVRDLEPKDDDAEEVRAGSGAPCSNLNDSCVRCVPN